MSVYLQNIWQGGGSKYIQDLYNELVQYLTGLYISDYQIICDSDRYTSRGHLVSITWMVSWIAD